MANDVPELPDQALQKRTHYSPHSWMNVFQDIGASACRTVSNMSPPMYLETTAGEASDGGPRS